MFTSGLLIGLVLGAAAMWAVFIGAELYFGGGQS